MFKVVPNYEGYKINQLGDVFGKRKRLMKKLIDKQGYLFIDAIVNEKRKRLLLHRAVALAFILNPENKPQVNHKNGIKSDNRVDNLEWCTAKENVAHSYEIGLRDMDKYKIQAAKNGKTTRILTIKQSKEILKSNLKRKELCIKYNVSPSTIDRILQNKTYLS